jgi:hypothetical protein
MDNLESHRQAHNQKERRNPIFKTIEGCKRAFNDFSYQDYYQKTIDKPETHYQLFLQVRVQHLRNKQ